MIYKPIKYFSNGCKRQARDGTNLKYKTMPLLILIGITAGILGWSFWVAIRNNR